MYVHTAIPVEGTQDENLNVTFRIRVKLYKATCANTVGEQVQEKVQYIYMPSAINTHTHIHTHIHWRIPYSGNFSHGEKFHG